MKERLLDGEVNKHGFSTSESIAKPETVTHRSTYEAVFSLIF